MNTVIVREEGGFFERVTLSKVEYRRVIETGTYEGSNICAIKVGMRRDLAYFMDFIVKQYQAVYHRVCKLP